MTRRRALLGKAMAGLSAREQHILRERKLTEEPQTLDELSQQYGSRPMATIDHSRFDLNHGHRRWAMLVCSAHRSRLL